MFKRLIINLAPVLVEVMLNLSFGAVFSKINILIIRSFLYLVSVLIIISLSLRDVEEKNNKKIYLKTYVIIALTLICGNVIDNFTMFIGLGFMMYIIVINYIVFKNYKAHLLKTYLLMCLLILLSVFFRVISITYLNGFQFGKDSYFYAFVQASIIFPIITISVVTLIVKINMQSSQKQH